MRGRSHIRRMQFDGGRTKEQVINKHEIGQVLMIWVPEAERTTARRRVRILAFNPNSILVESVKYKFKESFTYWDFIRIQSKPVPKPKIVQDKLLSELISRKGVSWN